MPLSETTLKAYEFLGTTYHEQETQKAPNILLRFCDIQIYGEIEKIDHFEWFPEEDAETISTHINALYEIGNDGGGGYFALWFYPGMTKEPPVIFSDGHGEFSFLAPTFSDYLLSLPKNHEDATPLSLKEKLKKLKVKINSKSSTELEKDLDELREDEEAIEEKDLFWQECWDLYDFVELCDEYVSDYEIDINIKETMQLIHDRLASYLDIAEQEFSLSGKNVYREEKKRYDAMIKELKLEEF